MRCRMRALVGGLAGTAFMLALAVSPALAQGGGATGPSLEGGPQYGAPLPRAPARPRVARGGARAHSERARPHHADRPRARAAADAAARPQRPRLPGRGAA